jgi:hypothetical protein
VGTLCRLSGGGGGMQNKCHELMERWLEGYADVNNVVAIIAAPMRAPKEATPRP